MQTATIEAEDQKNGGTRPAVINKYFAELPGQIIGNMVYSGGMFQDALNCVAPSSIDLGQEIEKRLQCLPPMQYAVSYTHLCWPLHSLSGYGPWIVRSGTR